MIEPSQKPRKRKTAMALAPLTLANVVTALLLAKVLATQLGPSGTGTYFLALAIMSFGAMIASLGLGPALSNIIAGREAGVRQGLQPARTFRLALWATTIASCVIAAAIFWLPVATHGTVATRAFVAAGVVPSAWLLVLQGALRGFRDYRAYARAGLIFAGANLLFTSCGAFALGVDGAVGGSMMVAVIGVVAVALELRRSFRTWGTVRDEATGVLRPHRLGLVVLGAAALTSLLAASAGQAIARWFIADHFGLLVVGYFAAAWSISNRVPSLVYQTYSTYLSPTLSSLTGNWEAIRREQSAALRLGLQIATPLLVALTAVIGHVIPLLLSRRFIPMEGMLKWMLVGELISVWYWSLSSALFPVGRTLASAVSEWSWWLTFVGLIVALSSRLGITGIGVAYFLAYAVMCGVLLLYEARQGFRPSVSSLAFVASSVTAVGGAAWLGPALPFGGAHDLAAGSLMLVLWFGALMITRSAERRDGVLLSRFEKGVVRL